MAQTHTSVGAALSKSGQDRNAPVHQAGSAFGPKLSRWDGLAELLIAEGK